MRLPPTNSKMAAFSMCIYQNTHYDKHTRIYDPIGSFSVSLSCCCSRSPSALFFLALHHHHHRHPNRTRSVDQELFFCYTAIDDDILDISAVFYCCCLWARFCLRLTSNFFPYMMNSFNFIELFLFWTFLEPHTYTNLVIHSMRSRLFSDKMSTVKLLP